MGLIFGRVTGLQVLFLPLALLLLAIGPSGAFSNLRHYSYKTPTLSQQALVSRIDTLSRRPTLFGIGDVVSIQQHRRVAILLRLAQDVDVSSDDASDSKTVTVISKVRRTLSYPFRKVATLFRRQKPAFVDMNINGEESDDSTSDSSKDESLVKKDVVDNAVQVVEASPSPLSWFSPTPVKASSGIVGDRWAVAAPSVDLTGEWNIKPFVTEEFKRQYDKYLKLLGQPGMVRSVAVSIVGFTTEETVQSDQGRELLIRGRNVRGLWERTLTASGACEGSDEFTPLRTSLITADAEKVEAEAWWEQNGTVHRSWLRGVTKYGGGEFESKRYLEDDGNVLVCESTFHPVDPKREKAQVTWRFLRQGAMA